MRVLLWHVHGAWTTAFVRGRHSQNLYTEAFDDALLDARVGALRARLGLDRPPPPATTADRAAFAATVALAALAAAAELGAILGPLALLVRSLAR